MCEAPKYSSLSVNRCIEGGMFLTSQSTILIPFQREFQSCTDGKDQGLPLLFADNSLSAL
jgi:hypothetical protein